MSETVEFTDKNLVEVKRIIAKYERPASALLPVLYVAQDQFGYLSPPVLKYVASLLEIPAAQAFEAASFYSMFKKKDMGRWCLQVCTNITCCMMGSDEILAAIKEEIGIEPGGMTEDKQFSLLHVQCLGSCDTAPVVQVNEDYHENLSPERVKEMIRSLSSK